MTEPKSSKDDRERIVRLESDVHTLSDQFSDLRKDFQGFASDVKSTLDDMRKVQTTPKNTPWALILAALSVFGGVIASWVALTMAAPIDDIKDLKLKSLYSTNQLHEHEKSDGHRALTQRVSSLESSLKTFHSYYNGLDSRLETHMRDGHPLSVITRVDSNHEKINDLKADEAVKTELIRDFVREITADLRERIKRMEEKNPK